MSGATLYRQPGDDEPQTPLEALHQCLAAIADKVQAGELEDLQEADLPPGLRAFLLALPTVARSLQRGHARWSETLIWAGTPPAEKPGRRPSLPDIEKSVQQLVGICLEAAPALKDWIASAQAEAAQLDKAALELSTRRAVLSPEGHVVPARAAPAGVLRLPLPSPVPAGAARRGG